MNLQVYTQTHKPDQTKININEFDMAKSAAQLLYGPELVFKCSEIKKLLSFAKSEQIAAITKELLRFVQTSVLSFFSTFCVHLKHIVPITFYLI